MKKIYTLVALAITSISFSQTTVTKQFNSFSFSNAERNPAGVIDSNISFTTAKNASSTDPTYYNSGGAIRLYPGDTDGGSITLNFSNGIIVSEVKITATTEYVQPISYKVDAETVVNVPSPPTSGNSYTYTFSNLSALNSFVFKNANTGTTGASNQLRITGTTITYTIATSPITPIITTNVNTLTNLNYSENQGPSVSQSFNVSGSNLNNSNVVITAPTNFEVSNDNITFGDSTTLTAFNGTSTAINVRLKSGLSVNTYTGNVSINGGGITTPINLNVSGEVMTAPILTTSTTTITNLNYTENQGPSVSQLFNLSGSNLNNSNVVITAPTNFEVSNDNITFGDSTTLTAFNGTSTPINVRLKSGLSVNTYTGNVSINGEGITTPINLNVSGEVIAETASIKENNIDGLRIYPNPASDVVYISSNEIGTKEVSIFNMLGKKVLEVTTDESINISTLNTGVYIMNITQDGKKASSKLVIK